MINQASIQIISLHKSEGREAEQYQTTVTGTCMRRDHMYYVSYTEREPDTSAETRQESHSSQIHTLLKLGPDKMEMKKTGAVQNHMVFEPGRRHVCLYRTVFGILEFEITGVTWEFAENSGSLQGHVEYQLRAGGQPLSACEMDIQISYDL